MLHVINAIIATVLSFLTAFSSVGMAGEAAGKPAYDHAAFVSKFDSGLRRRTLGLFPRGGFEISYDANMNEAFTNLKEGSDFDFRKVAEELPDFFYYLRWMYKLTPSVFNNLRDNMLSQAAASEKSGDMTKAVLLRILGVSMSSPEKLHFYSKSAGWLDGGRGHRVYIGITYGDGSKVDLDTGVNYFPETGMFNQYDSGVASSGFDIDTKNRLVTSSVNPQLQRKLGYTKLYDDLFLDTKMVNATTVRLKFDYKGKNWMLQLWKGRYFITSGGEVGLYNKTKGGGNYAKYDCAAQSERIQMSFRLYEKKGGTTLIDRPLTLHWWMTGFTLRKSLYTPENLRLETEIVPADKEMFDGLKAALDEQVSKNALSYTITNNDTTLAIKW